jgi:hypothetical protein
VRLEKFKFHESKLNYYYVKKILSHPVPAVGGGDRKIGSKMLFFLHFFVKQVDNSNIFL